MFRGNDWNWVKEKIFWFDVTKQKALDVKTLSHLRGNESEHTDGQPLNLHVDIQLLWRLAV